MTLYAQNSRFIFEHRFYKGACVMSARLLLHAVERMTGAEIWPGQMDVSLSEHCQDVRDGVSQAQIPLSQPG